MGDVCRVAGVGAPLTRRSAVSPSLALAGGAMAGGATSSVHLAPTAQATPAPSAPDDRADAILPIARDIVAKQDARAVILRVTIGGEEIVTAAMGESMTGVPATTDMSFRNGAVAIFYVATLLLRLVDQGGVARDDPLSDWMPELPDSTSSRCACWPP